jgi:hypothetical protein
MKSSELINELASALCAAQSQMGGAVKDSANPFFKSSYADLTSVIKVVSDDQIIAIKKLLDETGADSEKFCKWLKVNSVDQILAMHFDRAVAALEAKK